MGTKTISITEEAYEILKSRKEETESFSRIIVRLSGKQKLSDFAGALSKESTDRLEKELREIRTIHRKQHKKRLENDFR